MVEDNIIFKDQNIFLENRQKLTVTGVEQVESFNENTIILNTVKGGLTVKGENLNINKLNLEDGNLNIEGDIVGILYTEKKVNSKGKFFEKMFK